MEFKVGGVKFFWGVPCILSGFKMRCFFVVVKRNYQVKRRLLASEALKNQMSKIAFFLTLSAKSQKVNDVVDDHRSTIKSGSG